MDGSSLGALVFGAGAGMPVCDSAMRTAGPHGQAFRDKSLERSRNRVDPKLDRVRGRDRPASEDGAMTGTRRIVYVVAEDWSFLSHRLPMARAARGAGYDVHVVTRVARDRRRIEREGFTLHAVDLKRGTRRPTDLLVTVLKVRRVLKALRPTIVHNSAVQCAVVGSLASLGMSHQVINALTGLGASFASGAKRMRSPVERLLAFLLTRKRSTTLVQNPDDGRVIEALGVPGSRIAMIRGSGVDTDALAALPEPEGPFTVAIVCRMLAIKGVRTLIEAWRLLRGRGYRLLLVGAPDPSNPTSIPADEIRGWCEDESIRWLGHVEDIASIWRQAHVAVLASSGGEGLPLALLEAAACGRPIIASDAPGCREITRPDINGILFPVGDARALADAIDALATDRETRRRFGQASRAAVERDFSNATVQREIVRLYDTVAAAAP